MNEIILNTELMLNEPIYQSIKLSLNKSGNNIPSSVISPSSPYFIIDSSKYISYYDTSNIIQNCKINIGFPNIKNKNSVYNFKWENNNEISKAFLIIDDSNFRY